jgi:hypothetical protein
MPHFITAELVVAKENASKYDKNDIVKIRLTVSP